MPELRRLAQLIAQLRAVGILRLPADQTRPRRQQRLVDDLDLLEPLAGVARALVRGEQAGIDERVEHRFGRSGPLLACLAREHRQQVVAPAHGACALRRHEVAEQLAHERDSLRADALERRLRVLRQRTGDAADLVIRGARQHALLAVAGVPDLRGGEGQQRQRTALADHFVHHLVDERVVFELVAAREGRLHQGAPQRARAERSEQREVAQHRCERLVRVAVDQEVVPEGQDHVGIGLEHEAREELRERPLDRRRILREQLLELIDDDERVLVAGRAIG